MIGYERGPLLFLFNFHPTQSFADYRIGVSRPGKYRIALSSDRADFGGFDRIDEKTEIFSQEQGWHGLPYSIQVYIPSRVALVLELVK